MDRDVKFVKKDCPLYLLIEAKIKVIIKRIKSRKVNRFRYVSRVTRQEN